MDSLADQLTLLYVYYTRTYSAHIYEVLVIITITDLGYNRKRGFRIQRKKELTIERPEIMDIQKNTFYKNNVSFHFIRST